MRQSGPPRVAQSPISVTASDKFVSRGVFPEIEGTTPLRAVFSTLSRQPKDGFILTQQGQPHRYVLGATLAKAFMDQAKASHLGPQGAIAQLAEVSVGAWISTQAVSSFPIDERGFAGVTIGQLENGPDMVFSLKGPNATLGYFMNHETVRYAATGRVVWVCGNPTGGHDNPDPDHGSCAFCPFPIDHSEVR